MVQDTAQAKENKQHGGTVVFQYRITAGTPKLKSCFVAERKTKITKQLALTINYHCRKQESVPSLQFAC